MARSLLCIGVRTLVVVTLTSGVACERQPRAREREQAEQAAKAQREQAEAARLAALPPPEEPPVELLRSPSSGLPCAVDDVFARKCRRCHTIPTRHGAPFVFLTWDDTRQDRLGQPLYAVIGRAVQTGFMPYKIEANPPVQPLTEEEKTVILDWVDLGAPRGNCETDGKDAQKSAPPPSASTKSRQAAPVRRAQHD